MQRSEIISDHQEAVDRRSSLAETVRMMLRYKAWADGFVFDNITRIPEEETYARRQSTFPSIVQTLNHVYVVDDIFRHHLQGLRHAYQARVTPETPVLSELRDAVRAMDTWYIDSFDAWSDEDLDSRVEFEFVGGGSGSMTRGEIALHIVNHTTYHRGFVGDMLRQVPFTWPANDLTVFLRDHYRR
jgi:uncharacterized damage-inducible protein DinB